MGRSPCCDKQGMKKGPWTPEEDTLLVEYIQANGHGSWRSLPKLAGLQRCGKSCRLRWTNYLRPDIKRGPFTSEEQKSIIQLHGIVGNKWSTIAAQIPGRTDNEIKNYWNTHLKKRLLRMGIDPDTYYSPASSTSPPSTSSTARHMAQWESARLEAEARLSRQALILSSVSASTSDKPEADSVGRQQAKKPEADIILRIWNSEVGEAFRKAAVSLKREAASEIAEPRNSSSGEEVAVVKGEEDTSSTCNTTKHSSAVTVSEAYAGTEEKKLEEVESCFKDENTSDDTYDQFYLDLAAGDGLTGLYQSQTEESCFSMLSSFLNIDASSLDATFT